MIAHTKQDLPHPIKMIEQEGEKTLPKHVLLH